MMDKLTLERVELVERYAAACDRIEAFLSEYGDDYLDKLMACAHACDTIEGFSWSEDDMDRVNECASSIYTIENATWDEQFFEKVVRCAEALETIENSSISL